MKRIYFQLGDKLNMGYSALSLREFIVAQIMIGDYSKTHVSCAALVDLESGLSTVCPKNEGWYPKGFCCVFSIEINDKFLIVEIQSEWSRDHQVELAEFFL